MSLPGNGVFVIRGEIATLMTAMRRTSRWSSHSYHHNDDDQDPLLKNFQELKDILSSLQDLKLLEPLIFLTPFLDVIKSEDTTGPVTSLALSAVHKFISYGLLDPTLSSIGLTVHSVADAVTHARFVGTDQSSDAVVLMKILQVLRTLTLAPEGISLTNESLCEIMLSCFKICFETRLNELLRRTAEHYLKDMVQLVFQRLPQFPEIFPGNSKPFKMQPGSLEPTRTRKKSRATSFRSKTDIKSQNELKMDNKSEQSEQSANKHEITANVNSNEQISSNINNQSSNVNNQSSGVNQTVISRENGNLVDMQGIISQNVRKNSIGEENSKESDKLLDCANESGEIGNLDSNVFKMDSNMSKLDSNMFKIESNVFTTDETPKIDLNLSKMDSNLSTVDPNPSTTFTSLENPGIDSNLSKIDTTLSKLDTNTKTDSNLSRTDSTLSKTNSNPSKLELQQHEFVNPRGVRFIPPAGGDSHPALHPYDLACVRELFRFLVSLCNPHDRQNTEVMTSLGVGLLTVAYEVAAEEIGRCEQLMALVRDGLCRNLFSLLGNDRLSVFTPTLQLSFLLFQSQRSHLKFQFQLYLTRLVDTITLSPSSSSPTTLDSSSSSSISTISSSNPNSNNSGSGVAVGHQLLPLPTSYEHREAALEHLVQLYRLPSLVTELYLNYDCAMYSRNVCGDGLVQLAKYAYPKGNNVAGQGIYGTQILVLDALMSVIGEISARCHNASSTGDETASSLATLVEDNNSATVSVTVTSEGKYNYTRSVSEVAIVAPPSREELATIRNIKRWLPTGTEHFNTKAKKGIQFLQEHGVLRSPLDPQEVVAFLRDNPDLDKKQIGDYISARNNTPVLEAFVAQFDFAETRIDEALRMFLETFRLPGEAPLISKLLEMFAAHWHKANGEPFFDEDAAFTLAYAVIMLNVDQHNQNVRKQNNPMTEQGFKKNLTKVNGGSDFEQEMLDEIYTAIKSEEIVMPAEHTGLVRDNYLWKVLLRRGAGKDGHYLQLPPTTTSTLSTYDRELFALVWPAAHSALSYVYERAPVNNHNNSYKDNSTITSSNSSSTGNSNNYEESNGNSGELYRRALYGLEQCAYIAWQQGVPETLDTLLATLCKYTGLMGMATKSATITGVQLQMQLGANVKSQLALKSVFSLTRQFGDCFREMAWRNVLELLLALFMHGLLPKVFTEAEDFVEPSGKVQLTYEMVQLQKQEAGLLSSLYSYMVSSENITKVPTHEEQDHIDTALQCIQDCHLEQVITDSKFLHVASLQELVRTLVDVSRGPADGHTGYNETVTVFFLELLVKVALQNRDRVMTIWPTVRDHLYTLITTTSQPRLPSPTPLSSNTTTTSQPPIPSLSSPTNTSTTTTPTISSPSHLYPTLHPNLLHRAVVGHLRLAVRLMRNEELTPTVLHSLQLLLLLRPATLRRIARPVAYGLYELLKTSAQNVHARGDWGVVFALLECVGAGAEPRLGVGVGESGGMGGVVQVIEKELENGTRSDGDCCSSSPPPTTITTTDGVSSNISTVSEQRGYTSDSELTRSPRQQQQLQQQPIVGSANNIPLLQQTPTLIGGANMAPSTNNSGWILVGNEGEVQQVVSKASNTNNKDQYSLDLERPLLGGHDPNALLKCCESLAFLVRDVAHITPYNFDDCVHCIRTFVEASLQESRKAKRLVSRDGRVRRKPATTIRRKPDQRLSHRSPATSPDEDTSEDEENTPSGYHQVAIQLLDLMHTLHTRTAQIFRWWAEEAAESDASVEDLHCHQQMSLWQQGWCPLLQGIARLCCDTRKQVRMSAITYLQRALLVHDLQTLTGPEWEACFHRVLFPLLVQLLQPMGTARDLAAMEETRMRAATVLSKVFLHHLSPLLTLPTFSPLWLHILDFLDRYMHADESDLLAEAIPESLKNMLLVMESAGVFSSASGGSDDLWLVTWTRIGKFLPNLKEELFRETQQREGERREESVGQVDNVVDNNPPQAPVVQHNIESATRNSSIILQPPSTQHNMINSPLFAHLGQMVSTPIGPPTPILSQSVKPPPVTPSVYLPPPPPLPLTINTNIGAPQSPPIILSTQNSTNSTLSSQPFVLSAPSFIPNSTMTLPQQQQPQQQSSTVATTIQQQMTTVQQTLINHTFPILYSPVAPSIVNQTVLVPPTPSVNPQQQSFPDPKTNNNHYQPISPVLGLGDSTTNTNQPHSLYADYLGNPYNIALKDPLNGNTVLNQMGQTAAEQTNAVILPDNVFQSSNYFTIDGGSSHGGDLFSSSFVPSGANIPLVGNREADFKNSN